MTNERQYFLCAMYMSAAQVWTIIAGLNQKMRNDEKENLRKKGLSYPKK